LTILIAILTLVLVAVVVFVVSAPLRATARRRSPRSSSGPPGPLPANQAELEAAREAKYREIRDAELDYRTGKLSQEDYEAIDVQLRSEALEILDRIEAEDR
jgi:hypothetical protein